ncbi:hypothetical protein LCGC14_0253780 [marine sediment metagenome]|uniref:Uncharacterized protein n=1 Tax=marine sediment metagenome TaxID=412755 RepID=A0A0F9UKI4_9ZZZZ
MTQRPTKPKARRRSKPRRAPAKSLATSGSDALANFIAEASSWLWGRFENDIEIWKEKLGDDLTIGPVDRGMSLRFYLKAEEDFRRFKEFAQTELSSIAFLDRLELTSEMNDQE